MLRTVLISGLATALLGGAALAADLPTKKAPPVFVPPPVAVSWTGFYVGVNGGYAGDEFRYPLSASYGLPEVTLGGASGEAKLTSSGFLGGVQVGFNYQFAPSWVGGLEADIDATSIKGEASLSASGYFEDVSGSAGVTAKSEIPYLGTARVRVGYLVTDRFLMFATGGLAYGEVKTSASVGVSVPAMDDFALGYSYSKNNTRAGWTVGGGVEYKLNPNWSFKTEYLYVDLGEATVAAGAFDIGDATLSYSLKEHATDHIVRAGLNYTFN